MSSIARGTTPTFKLSFPANVGLDDAVSIYVTFTSGMKSVTKTGQDVSYSDNKISVWLTQKETFLFKEGDVEIQANWITSLGKRISSEVKPYNVSKQLLNEVIR